MPKFISRMYAAPDERIAPGALDGGLGIQYQAGQLINIDYAPDGSYVDLTFEATQTVTDLAPRKTSPVLGQLHTERPGHATRQQ
jgi:hypothetical protein